LPLVFKTCLYSYPEIDAGNILYDKMYRPLQLVSYSLDYRIWGLNPFGFHLHNLLIHTLNAILVFYLFSLLGGKLAAGIISILFTIHPIQVSVVSYISSRADLLVSFFILLSVILFFKFSQLGLKRYYVFSLLSAALALLCRENATILFLFILLVLFVLKSRPLKFLYAAPFILLAFLYFALRFMLFGAGGLAAHPHFLSQGLLIINFLNITLRYVGLLILPLDLHLVRTTAFITGLFDARVFFALVFILVYIYLIIKMRDNKLALFGMLWFLLGLIPVLFSLDGYAGLRMAMMAESWLYLASPGFFVFFVILGDIFRKKRITKIPLILVALFYLSLTIANNAHWKNGITVYTNILKYTSENNPMRKYLAREYMRKGLYENALSEIKKFSRYCPECSERYILEGDYHYALDEIPRAIDKYRAALVISPDNFIVFYKLSRCFDRMGEQDKALEFALRSVNINPRYLDGLAGLGDLYGKNKNPNEAIKYYKMYLQIDPGNKILEEKIKNAK
ncbi:MAG: hypothetical protein M0R66_09410, partial [Candidatus Omnitrophica bacterium]|nr:hypothetical protein [Candidatus Omnitrophota bacterium]